MATVGRPLDGSDIFLFLTIGAEPVLLGCAQDISLDVQREERNVACKATGKWGETVKGMITWTATVKGLHKVYTTAEKTAGNIGADDLYDNLVSDDPIPMKYGSTTIGDPQWAGDVHTMTWKHTGGQGAEATYDVTMKGTGELVKTYVTA